MLRNMFFSGILRLIEILGVLGFLEDLGVPPASPGAGQRAGLLFCFRTSWRGAG